MLSTESWDYHFKRVCEEKGYDGEHLTEEQRDEVYDAIHDAEYANTEGMLDYACHYMGEELFYKFYDFISDYKINDLHAGNWGFYNGTLVVVDYAGYEIKLMN